MDPGDRSQLLGGGGGKAEELEIGRDLLEEHVGADLGLTTLSCAALRKGVMACFITTSPTKELESSRDMSMGSGSPSFIPRGVALTTTSYPAGSFEPVVTSRLR